MMTQPELGKKIAELRKAKGFTQEELVEKCNLSVRTLQRIESGEVAPRTYTIRLIFTALDFNVHENPTQDFDEPKFQLSDRLSQFYGFVSEMFNFKTNPMKKITVLAVTLGLVFAGVFFLSSETKAQKAEKAIKAIEEAQAKGNQWMKEGKIDSVLTLYRDDVTVFPNISGKAEVRLMLDDAADGGFKLKEFRNISISVADSIAVQKYYDVYEYRGVEYRQKGMTEWRLTKGKWLTVNDIMINY
jgi:transcriptional regulator with XRE-family HTH domain